MATVSDSIGKGTAKVDEKFWHTFYLELQTLLVHLPCDDLIVEKKPRPADPADATTPASIIAAAAIATVTWLSAFA